MMLRVGMVDLWVEATAGSADHPSVVLISGADSPCSHWPEGLIQGLIAAGYGVVRFDHRDVGRSSVTEPTYGLDDLVGDVVGLLDELRLERAHVFGSSMGGMVAQKLAIARPERLVSLTVVISSPDPHRVWLTGPDTEWEEALTELVLAAPPRSDAAKADRAVETARLLAGPRYPFDADAKRERALAELAAEWPEESGHALALGQTEPWLDSLGVVQIPTLVIHGDSDPLFAPDHGEALASEIPTARLLMLEGLGHEIPPGLVDDVLPALVEHLEGAE